MSSARRAVGRIQNTMTCNRFLFWGSRIPGAKAVFSDRVFADLALKATAGRVILTMKWIYDFLGKLLYLFVCGVLPLYLRLEDGVSTRGFPFFVQILFFLSFLAGTLMQSDILAPTLLKYCCVRQMNMPAAACVAATTGRLQGVMAITFTPALMLASAALGRSPLLGLVLSVELAAMRLFAEFLWLVLYDKTGRVWAGTMPAMVLFTLLGLGGAYLPLALGLALPLDALLLSVPGLVGFLLLGGGAALYLRRYPRYRALIYRRCRADTVPSPATRAAAGQSLFRDVELRDRDLGRSADSAAVAGLRGYRYLNKLFFLRHRRLLLRPLLWALCAVGALFVAGLVGVLFWREETAQLMAAVPESLRYFVFFMYFACNTVGTRICKAMFYNCDISLLRYGWYRERGVVLENFKLRLKHIAALNLSLGGAICLAAVVLTLLSGVPLLHAATTLPPFLLGVLLLSLLFSIHPLFLYYVFQPYTTSLAVKNPFFSLIGALMYGLCYGCIYIHRPPAGLTLLILCATALYCAAALWLVWQKAPKTFRVK